MFVTPAVGVISSPLSLLPLYTGESKHGDISGLPKWLQFSFIAL
jgi:hypothetical protein